MKTYFTASARGKAKLEDNYRFIYDTIEQLGHKNLDDLVSRVDTDDFYKGSHADQVGLFKKAMRFIKKSDVVILEVSVHSLSMGFVMQKALEISKPVVALYVSGHEPYFALGIDSDKLQVVEYTKSNLEKVLKRSISYAQEQMDTRFNFFISPKIGSYLDWIAKKKKTPRAVYLRGLIEEDLKKQKEYKIK